MADATKYGRQDAARREVTMSKEAAGRNEPAVTMLGAERRPIQPGAVLDVCGDMCGIRHPATKETSEPGRGRWKPGTV